MGDIVLTTALIRCLRHKYKNARIDFLIGSDFAEIVKFNPYINNVYLYFKDNPELNNELKQNLQANYKIIDLQNNHKSHQFIKGLGSEIVSFNKLRMQKLVLVWLKKNLFPDTNIAERYIQTASPFGVENDNDGLEIWLEKEKNEPIYPPKILTPKINNDQIFIAIAPGAKHKTKQWLPEYFAELMNLLSAKYNAEFYLLGGKADYHLCEYIASITAVSTMVHNYSGKKSILDTINTLDRCNILITNDTGIMHIGAARRKPIVAIFGATKTEFGFTPYKTKYEICEVKDLKCRPCSHYGKSKCSKKHFKCMTDIKPENVLEKIGRIL